MRADSPKPATAVSTSPTTATVSIRAGPPPLLVALSGGDPVVAHDMLTMRAAELT